MEILGIRFAPFDVSLERRIQTASTAFWIIFMALGGFIGLLTAIYLILFTRLWWIVLIYLFYIWVIDKDICEKGGRPSKWVRSWSVWKHHRDYFPAKLEKLPSVELDPKKNYLFCCFPHGIMGTGPFAGFASENDKYRSLFPHHQTRQITLTQHYYMPFFRDVALGLGGMGSSFKALDYILSKPEGGYIEVLLVGGAAESYHCKPGNNTVVLNKRKGFVKLALKSGSPLVPVYTFGETDLYDQVEGTWLKFIQEKVRKFIGIAPVVLIGRGFFQYSFGLIPRRHPITCVVGQPLEVPKVENPSRELVQEYHEKFVKQLTALFEEQKYNYLEKPEEKHLVIT